MTTSKTAPAVLVTGASTGIGADCAHHLDSLGMRVYAGVRRDSDGAALAEQSNGRIIPLTLDITDAGHIVAAAKRIADDGGGRLDGLVNNAGIAVAGPLEFIPIDDFRRQIEVNLVGHLAVVQAMLPLLREAAGRIVMVSSLAGRLAQPLLGPYSASKFALEAVSDVLRVELRPWRIGVSVVEPGAVRTPIWNKSLTASDALANGMPAAMEQLYGRAMSVTRAFANSARVEGVAPAKVSSAVAHALTAPRPRTRYRIGQRARVLIPLTPMLPDRLLDAIMLRAAHLPR